MVRASDLFAVHSSSSPLTFTLLQVGSCGVDFPIRLEPLQEEMKHRLEYPEKENLTKQECIEELNQLFRGYRFDSSYRCFIIKDTQETWEDQRTVGYMGRVMLRLGKLVF
jgi:hypothetical protein